MRRYRRAHPAGRRYRGRRADHHRGGRFDEQSPARQLVSALAAGAAPRGILVLVLAGQVALGPATLRDAGIAAAYQAGRLRGLRSPWLSTTPRTSLASLARRTAAELG